MPVMMSGADGTRSWGCGRRLPQAEATAAASGAERMRVRSWGRTRGGRLPKQGGGAWVAVGASFSLTFI